MLHEMDIVAPGEPSIRSSLEQNGEFPVGVRAIDIAAENHAVAHFDRDAGFDPDWVLLARRALQSGKQTEKKKERQPAKRHQAEHSEILPLFTVRLWFG
jgi:hypothetical protein